MEPPCMISMEFSTSGRDDCYYRIRDGPNVKYITVQAGALDAEALMDMPLNFQTILPPLPFHEDDWDQAYISRSLTSGELDSKRTRFDLPGVRTIWHPRSVNFLDLERTRQLSLLSQECMWNDQADSKYAHETPTKRTVIAKMARFPWEIGSIETETRIYKLLQALDVAPRFLGHIQEAGRVIGFLLEKIEGRCAGLNDSNACQKALRRLHSSGILHGDCNRYNFIIGVNGRVTLIDFENGETGASAGMMQEELDCLEEQLREKSGRGGGFFRVEAD